MRSDSDVNDLRVLGRLLMGILPEAGPDWEAMAALAERHGVMPLLYWRIKEQGGDGGQGGSSPEGERVRGGWDAVPEGVLESLQEAFFVAAARGIVAERQLARVLGALAAAGVPAVVVKGAAVGAFYPDPALRAYSDLDVLVPQEMLDRAEGALNELGYHCSGPKEWRLEQHLHLPLMVGGDGQISVEVHWRLDDPRRVGRLPADDLWARAVPWSVEGQEALRLDAVDAALHLCRHAVVQHQVRLGLRSVCDVVRVTEGWDRVQWQALAERAVAYDLERTVYLMLWLAEDALGLAVPPDVMEHLCRTCQEPLPEDIVERFLAMGTRSAASMPSTAARAMAQGPFRARIRYLLRNLFLTRDGLATLYNIPADSPWIWLAYVRHPVKLLRRYGRIAWAVLRGEGAARATWERDVWLERWLRGEGGSAS